MNFEFYDVIIAKLNCADKRQWEKTLVIRKFL